ncbi:MAG: hypothetical protein ACM3X7_14155 [Solirubrobacterales bacterium]
MSSFVNTGFAKKNDFIMQQASVVVYSAEPDTLEMTKTVDKPGHIYVTGDTIVFTINITLPATSPAKLSGITFEDQVPPQVILPSAPPYGVSTTKGIIVPVISNLVKITAIDLDVGETCTITIAGTIA